MGVKVLTFTKDASASNITHKLFLVKLLVKSAAWQFGIQVFSLKLKYKSPVHDVQLLAYLH